MTMITDNDIKKLKTVFATKDDLKMYATKDDLKNYPTKVDMQNEFQKYTDMIMKEMTDLISVVLEKIDAFKVSMEEKSDYQNDVINTHERRIEKLEERVYTTTSS